MGQGGKIKGVKNAKQIKHLTVLCLLIFIIVN